MLAQESSAAWDCEIRRAGSFQGSEKMVLIAAGWYYNRDECCF